MTRVLAVTAGSHSVGVALIRTADDPDAMDELAAETLDVEPGSDEATDALRDLLGTLPDEPDAVGHRLVHGARVVAVPTVVDDALADALGEVADLAPQHVPPALALLAAARSQLPDVPHFVCPDTAFHAGLPPAAAMLPLPAEWRERWGLHRYGFHGLSYAWASRRAAVLLGRPSPNLVIAHLGGGGSVCAVAGGRSVDTTMGMTPLDGIPMTKRSGAVDPGLLLWLLDGRLTRDELAEGLQKKSGLLGMSGGLSDDTRELVGSSEPAAAAALDAYAHAVRRAIGAMAASLPHLDALVFTGEIGWDQPEVRAAVCSELAVLGVQPVSGGNREDDGLISAPDADVPVLVVQVKEEHQIALEVATALHKA
ncbi:acetate/propionate family kinase [Cryptosporangium aurantiacum]|uniref:Acetate kinase n=1 Tax=Cryptosporangium aurantiacum TaxID=134849 RepID=A0A1M7RIW3_9ACTN|nr:acetate/propionate family kinase [Cryptosporangium aurantiacum]SHN46243.1 acetate kinase [Cryptosporangium aurantiacum]